MYYIVETSKNVEQAASDLEAAVKEFGFGVLHTHNIGQTLRNKGVDFDRECLVLEVCNPKQAARVLDVEMSLNMALPCRISVYTENGTTKIGLIKPSPMLATLSDNSTLAKIAREVEELMIKMVDKAR